VHLVEPEPLDQTDPLENYRQIRAELEAYDPSLIERPEIVAISKGELPGAAELASQLQNELARPVILMSAVTGKGLPALIAAIWRELMALENSGATLPM
jgi:GTP-binding protein